MNKKLPTQTYRWQPEIATSLIYWSLTFTILFTALIVQLEMIKLNPYSIGLGIIFICFVWLGLQRKVWILEDKLMIKALKKKNSYQIPLSDITEISIGSNGLTIEQDGSEIMLIMRTESKKSMIADIQHHPSFQGEVKGL